MSDTPDTVTVAGEDGAVRLDRWFKRHYPALGHSRLERLLRTGRIRVDGKRAHSGDRLAPGQAIRIPPLDEMTAPAPHVPRPVSLFDEVRKRCLQEVRRSAGRRCTEAGERTNKRRGHDQEAEPEGWKHAAAE